MMHRNNIPELHGPDALAEAGQMVLDDLTIAGVVVRNVVDVATVPPLNTKEARAEFASNIYNVLPGLTALDAVLAKWSFANGSSVLTASPQPQRVLFLEGSSDTHIDNEDSYTPGPLFLGLRLDNHPEIKRIYTARRIGKSTLGANNKVRTNTAHWLEMWPSHFGARLPIGRFGRAEQQPGDGLFIPGNPFTALHRLHAKKLRTARTAGTQSFGLDYSLQVQNTNTHMPGQPQLEDPDLDQKAVQPTRAG